MRIATVFSILLLAGCASAPPPVFVDTQTLASGSYAATTPNAPEAHLIQDDAAYRTAWSAMIGEGEPPPVDFQTKSVVILLGGLRLTGGWTVETRTVVADKKAVSITAVINSPPAGAVVTHALTSPWAVLAVPKRETLRPVKWER